MNLMNLMNRMSRMYGVLGAPPGAPGAFGGHGAGRASARSAAPVRRPLGAGGADRAHRPSATVRVTGLRGHRKGWAR